MNNVIHCQIKAKKFSMVFFMAIFLTLLLGYSNGVYADQTIPEHKQNLQQDSTFSVVSESRSGTGTWRCSKGTCD